MHDDTSKLLLDHHPNANLFIKQSTFIAGCGWIVLYEVGSTPDQYAAFIQQQGSGQVGLGWTKQLQRKTS